MPILTVRRLTCGSFLVFLIATLFVICLQTPTVAFAQSELAGVYGRVTDASGAVIAEVEIEIKNVETNVSVLAKTNPEGLYTIPSLRPGHYLIFARKPGFKTVTVTGLDLNVQDNVIRNFTLQVGSISETVTVKADDLHLNTTDATVGTVVDRQFLENMPLNGRSLHALIALTPGVMTPKPNDANPGQFSVNGQRTDTNYFSVDGVSANVGIAQGGDSSFVGSASAGASPPVAVTGGTNNLVSIDAMQEFKIQTSTFAPEFGRTPGAQISIVTRSGTNQFHGTAFEFLRNDIFDARDWFTNYYSLPKPMERLNDFGGVLGGPILKNRLFFFFSYEGLRLRQPQTKTEIEPSIAARTQAPADIQPLLNAFPIPNISSGPITGVFAASLSSPSTLNATSIRVDYALTNKISVFGRYNHGPSNGTKHGSFDYYALSTVQRLVSNVDTFTVGANVTFKSNLVNEFRFNNSRATGASEFSLDNFGGAVPLPESYLWQSFPQGNSKNDNFDVFFTPDINGLYTGGGYKFHQRQLNFVDSVAWTLGSHTIKAGVDYRRLMPTPSNFPYQVGIYFSGIAGALSGTPSLATVAASDAQSLRYALQNLSFFAQDTWQATPNLALTYGLRWDYNPPPSDTSGHPLYSATNLNDPANVAVAPAGTPFWKATHDNFAPRLGVAYQLRKTPGREMVVRVGAGLFYDLGNNTSVNGWNYFPHTSSRTLLNPQYPLSTADAASPPFTLNPPYGAVQGFDPNLKLPRVYQWNVSVQQSLGSNQTVTVTYVGANGRKLLRDEIIVPSAGLNSNFASVPVTTNDAYSNYDALQVQFQRRLSRGLQVLASYSFAHALDNTSNQFWPSPYHTVYNPAWDYGNSEFDVRHSLSSAISYNIPAPGKSRVLQTIAGNWALDSLFRSNSARPVNVLTGLDPFGLVCCTVNGYGRPDVVPNQPFYLYGSQYPGGKALNPAAFQNPTSSGTPGNLGRNALWGFGAWEEDLAIRREFPIREQVKLQFRAEFFNLFNHPNFGDPGILFSGTNQLTSSLFGLSTSTLAQSLNSGTGNGGFSPLFQIGGPRSIQLALKVIF